MEVKYPYKFSKIATEDLRKITDYISYVLLNPSASEKLVYEFFDALERISLFPLSCSLVQNKLIKEQGLRKLIVQKYILFYKFEENEIRVVRILYGMRNYSNLL